MAKKQDRLNERLIDASMNGRLHRVVEALEEGADLEARDSNGKTALMRAAFYGKVRVVNKLLQAGADPNARAAERHGDRPGREDGTTALMQVADGVFIGNHDEVIRALVEGGADVNLHDSHGQTALMWACERTPLAAKTLLELGAKVDLHDNHGETALMKAVKHADHPFFRQACAEIIALLKQHGATEEGLDVVDLL